MVWDEKGPKHRVEKGHGGGVLGKCCYPGSREVTTTCSPVVLGPVAMIMPDAEVLPALAPF